MFADRVSKLGRIDRKIEFPLPDIKTKRKIFQIHTGKMTLSPDVNLEEFIHTKDDLSGADIKVGVPSSPPSSSIFLTLGPGNLHRGWSAGIARATDEGDARGLQSSEGESAVSQERRRSRRALHVKLQAHSPNTDLRQKTKLSF